MAKVEKDPFRCTECGWTSQKWVGRCGECQAWGAVEEIAAPKKLSLVPGNVTSKALPIGDVDLSAAHARPTGVSELDRVLGGGLVPGAAILLAGEPGVGKSTLLLSVAAQSAAKAITSLYISGEESASQVRLRAERIKAVDPKLFIASETDLGAVIAHIDAVKPLIRAIKNRFGASDEVGCFDLSDSGIESVLDPTGLFTSRHVEPVPGTCVTVTLEGRRPLLAEIQALVSAGRENDFGNARRVVSGLDSARTSMTLAVLELRAHVRVGGRDVYAATVGGMKMTEPAADLALALAVASAAKSLALPADLVAIGEVGLAGEIRKVSGVNRRLQEAYRLGFKRALVPTGSDVKIAGMEIFEVSRLGAALHRVKINGE